MSLPILGPLSHLDYLHSVYCVVKTPVPATYLLTAARFPIEPLAPVRIPSIMQTTPEFILRIDLSVRLFFYHQ